MEETALRLPETFEPKIPLKIRPDGGFRVLILTDIHHSDGEDDVTMRAMCRVMDRTKPDFVMLGGDIITGKTDEASFQRLAGMVVRPMEERRIPWAHVFGNHDAQEGPCKRRQEMIYEQYPFCLSAAGPEDIPGTGNYFLPVTDETGEPVFGIWGLDAQQDFSRPSDPLDYRGDLSWDLLMPGRLSSRSDDDFIRFEQVMWYYNTSRRLEKLCGHKIPSLMVFHIPLFEFNAILRNAARTGMRGEYNEGVSSSEVNSGLFAAALQRGDVTAMFAGHDHINTFDGLYCGIRMGCCGGIGYHTYGARDNDPGRDKNRLRGGRVVDFDVSDPWHPRTEMIFAGE